MNNKNTLIKSPYSKKQRKNYFMIDNDYVTLYAKHLGVMATAVYTSLRKHADIETNRCWPSMDLIAEQHGIGRHTVSKALKRLEEWNMIHVVKSYNRKLKRRKNNTYILIPIEFWKKLLVEDEDYGTEDTIEEDDDDDLPFESPKSYNCNKSHGTEDTMYMVSKIPNYGTEDTSNKTHVTRPIKEDSLCGEPTELPLSLSRKLQLLKGGKSGKSKLGVSKSAVWNSDKAIQSLINNDCKDYQIIGKYFLIQKLVFNSKLAFEEKLKRSLRPAKDLVEYQIDDIKKTMWWLNNAEFDFEEADTNWSLEAVNRYIEDCIATDFIPDGRERDEQLNIINA